MCFLGIGSAKKDRKQIKIGWLTKEVINRENGLMAIVEGENFKSLGVMVDAFGKQFLVMVNADLPKKRREEIEKMFQRGTLPIDGHIHNLHVSEMMNFLTGEHNYGSSRVMDLDKETGRLRRA